MRYYKIVLGPDTYTNSNNGVANPGGLRVYLDIPVTVYATPSGQGFVRIWGAGLDKNGQASDLFGKDIQVFGGMQKGFPLANPAQAGLLATGTIIQPFGNWIDTDQTLDIIFGPKVGTPSTPVNLTLNWKQGQKLSEAVKSAITTAFPGYTTNINISDKVVAVSNQTSYYQTLEQLAAYVKTASKAIVGSGYQGVDIALNQKTFSLFDGTVSQGQTKNIQFQDLIGQPTWIDSPSIQLKCVMRGDIKVGDSIKLPQGITSITTAASQSQFRDKSVFQGEFQVSFVRHVGDSRQPTAESWVTVINAFPVKKAAAT